MSNPQVKTLLYVLQQSQNLYIWYLSLLKNVDPHQSFECNGKKLNSLYWICGHMAWAENMLINQALGKKEHSAPWLKLFELGATELTNGPSLEEIKTVSKEIHRLALENVGSLKDEELEENNVLNFGFGGDTSKRMIITHQIRHLGTHTGHLGWLCKLHGIKAI
jgi:uncharacterized damage-inducible protein DinB